MNTIIVQNADKRLPGQLRVSKNDEKSNTDKLKFCYEGLDEKEHEEN